MTVRSMTKSNERRTWEARRRTWEAMSKFAKDKPLTEQEWQDLSWITLIDRAHLVFEPGNTRWATTDAERADNEAFYRSLASRNSL
jgi:hypothetical protein